MAGNGNRKRSLVFEAVQKLETQDAVARTKRRATAGQVQTASQAALAQQEIYGKLLMVRILVNRALQQAPPQKQASASGDNGDDRSNVEAIDKCTQLLTMLLQAREKLSRNIDTDDDDRTAPTDYNLLVKNGDQLEECLQSEFEAEKGMWKEVLDRRHKDVRLHAGLAAKSHFRVLDASFWDQVESTVRHDQQRQESKKESQPFDDSKVYRQLLNEFGKTNPAQGSEGSRVSERARSGTRRTVNQVDRRASKGRKLRYTPIPKLANFTYPLSRPAAILDDDAWFKSLFGGATVAKKG